MNKFHWDQYRRRKSKRGSDTSSKSRNTPKGRSERRKRRSSPRSNTAPSSRSQSPSDTRRKASTASKSSSRCRGSSAATSAKPAKGILKTADGFQPKKTPQPKARVGFGGVQFETPNRLTKRIPAYVDKKKAWETVNASLKKKNSQLRHDKKLPNDNFRGHPRVEINGKLLRTHPSGGMKVGHVPAKQHNEDPYWK